MAQVSQQRFRRIPTESLRSDDGTHDPPTQLSRERGGCSPSVTIFTRERDDRGPINFVRGCSETERDDAARRRRCGGQPLDCPQGRRHRRAHTALRVGESERQPERPVLYVGQVNPHGPGEGASRLCPVSFDLAFGIWGWCDEGRWRGRSVSVQEQVERGGGVDTESPELIEVYVGLTRSHRLLHLEAGHLDPRGVVRVHAVDDDAEIGTCPALLPRGRGIEVVDADACVAADRTFQRREVGPSDFAAAASEATKWPVSRSSWLHASIQRVWKSCSTVKSVQNRVQKAGGWNKRGSVSSDSKRQ